MAHALGVHCEIGQLRQSIVHRPGLELNRLTPGNCHDLLFDDVPWAAKAREEHDVFAETLRSHGVTVHHFDTLLTETLELPEARAFVLGRLCTPELLGPTLIGPLRLLAEDTDAAALAELLIGGVTHADLSPLQVGSLRWQSLELDDFVLPPLPNTLSQRDTSAWIYDGLTITQWPSWPGNANPCTAAPSTGSTHTGRPAGVGALGDAAAVLAGTAGTTVVARHPSITDPPPPRQTGPQRPLILIPRRKLT